MVFDFLIDEAPRKTCPAGDPTTQILGECTTGKRLRSGWWYAIVPQGDAVDTDSPGKDTTVGG